MTLIHDIEEKVRSFIVSSFLTAQEADSFRDDTDLLTLLDSLQILRLVIAMEAACAVKVSDADMTPDNLGSVQKIAAFLVRKGAGQPQPAAAQ